MRYRSLDSNGDFSFGSGQNDFLINTPEAVAQAVVTRLRLYLAEWFLDTTDGTDWKGKVLGKYTASSRDIVLQARILDTTGVSSILSYSSYFDPPTRVFTVNATIDTIYGAVPIVASQSVVLPPPPIVIEDNMPGPPGPAGPPGPPGPAGPAGPATTATLVGADASASLVYPFDGSTPKTMKAVAETTLRNVGISRQSSFDAGVADIPIYRDFVFGTGATVTGSQIAIRNLTDLGNYFTAFEDFTGTTTINSELEIYQPFNSTTHAFTADRLNLTCSLDTANGYGGTYASVVRQTSGTITLDGTTANPIANMGWANTNGVELGSVLLVQFSGTYYVNAIVSNTSVTLKAYAGSSATTQTNNLNVVTPLFVGLCNGAVANAATSVVLSNLPAGVTVGMNMGVNLLGKGYFRNQDHRVTAVDAGTKTVTFTPALSGYGTISSGVAFIFSPPVISGQLWTKDYLDLTNSSTTWACDARCVFPSDSSGGYNTKGISTLTAFNAVPADHPWGFWPGFWLYSANDGNFQSDTSEIDILEMNANMTLGLKGWMGNDHGPVTQVVYYKQTTLNGWTVSNGFQISPTTIVGNVRTSNIYFPGKSYKYLNNALLLETAYTWTSGHKAQLSLVNACGQIDPTGSATMLFPYNVTNFANMQLGLQRLTIYKSTT